MGVALTSQSVSKNLSELTVGRQMLVFIDSCELGLIPRRNSSNDVDAFSLDIKNWMKKYSSCNVTWYTNYNLEYNISRHIGKNEIQKSLNLFISSKNQLFTLYVVALIKYASHESVYLRPLIEFSAALPRQELRLAAYESIYTRTQSFASINIDILNLYFLLANEEGQQFSNLLGMVNKSASVTISYVCYDLKAYHENQGWAFFFSKLEMRVQAFFLPHIFSICNEGGELRIAEDLIQYAKRFISQIHEMCEFLHHLFLTIKYRTQLDTVAAGKLTDYSEELVKNHADQDGRIEEVQKCSLVVQEMLNHTLAMGKEDFYMKAFDSGDWKSLQRSDKSFMDQFVPRLIRNRYGGDSENASRLIKFFWGKWQKKIYYQTPCEESRQLAGEMAKYGRLASFELISLLTHLQSIRLI